VSYSPITHEASGLDSWDQLYAKDPAAVICLMGEKDVPLQAGDAFLPFWSFGPSPTWRPPRIVWRA
jgi:hypothetical protein